MMKRLLGTLAGITAILVISVPAVAAPTTMQLSSWAPEFSDGIATGGTQTVTLTNVAGETVSNASFSLEPAPCDCAVVSYSASRGSLDRSVWTIDSLKDGEAATLTVQYQDSPALVAGSPASDVTGAAKVAVVLSTVVLLAGLILSRPDRFRIASS